MNIDIYSYIQDLYSESSPANALPRPVLVDRVLSLTSAPTGRQWLELGREACKDIAENTFCTMDEALLVASRLLSAKRSSKQDTVSRAFITIAQALSNDQCSVLILLWTISSSDTSENLMQDIIDHFNGIVRDAPRTASLQLAATRARALFIPVTEKQAIPSHQIALSALGAAEPDLTSEIPLEEGELSDLELLHISEGNIDSASEFETI